MHQKISVERPEVCALLRGAPLPFKLRVANFLDKMRYGLFASWCS